MTSADNMFGPIRDLQRRVDDLEKYPSAPPLKSGDGGGTSSGMEAVDAKIAAAEARTDTKFSELRGYLKDFATKGTVWQAIATGTAIVLAAIAFGGDRFDSGISLADKQQAQLQRDEAQDASVKRMESKLDEVIRRLPASK